MLNRITVIYLFLLLMLCQSVMAQSATGTIDRIRFYYENLEFEKALREGNHLLQRKTSLSPEDLLSLHKYLGVIYFSLGDQDSAYSHFLTVLSLDKKAELDPVYFSPKIISFFDNIKMSLQREHDKNPAISYTKYVFLEDRRPGAAWRSAVFPGWGQMYKSQKKRALLFGSAFAAGLVLTGVSYIQENNAHNKYLDAKDPAAIPGRYDTYNKWYKTRRTLSLVTAAVWALSVSDAMFLPAGSHIEISRLPGGTMLGMKFSF